MNVFSLLIAFLHSRSFAIQAFISAQQLLKVSESQQIVQCSWVSGKSLFTLVWGLVNGLLLPCSAPSQPCTISPSSSLQCPSLVHLPFPAGWEPPSPHSQPAQLLSGRHKLSLFQRETPYPGCKIRPRQSTFPLRCPTTSFNSKNKAQGPKPATTIHRSPFLASPLRLDL